MTETAFAEPAVANTIANIVADTSLPENELAPTGPMEFSALGLAPQLEQAVANPERPPRSSPIIYPKRSKKRAAMS